MRVGIIGCGLVGGKRAAALRGADDLVGAFDVDGQRLEALVNTYGGRRCRDVEALFGLEPDAVIVAVTHDQLAPLTKRTLEAGAHVLVEKPAGLGSVQIEELAGTARMTGRRVKVGFNHRFHPAIARLAAEVHSGAHGALMHLRARYGHGGRPGYDREWRADPRQAGGGELVDQGMHLIDLAHWLAGPLPLHCALLRTHFWDTPVEDNAALILGVRDDRAAPWALLHVSWTEWKNTFSLEAYCRTAKLEVAGLVHSYGPQTLRLHKMRPELGPPELEEISFPDDDTSWSREWEHFTTALASGDPMIGDLDDARYAWRRIEDAYAASPAYADLQHTSLG